MSTLETRKIEPLSGTTVTLGASGDAVTVPAGATLKTNTVKDAGGNTLWTSDGSGTLSSVNAGLSGNMIFISSQTASGSASISFTSGIDSTYDEYVFYFVNLHPATDNVPFTFQASTDGGSNYNVTMTTTAFRAYHNENDGGAAVSYQTTSDQAQGTGYQQIAFYGVDNDVDSSASGVLHLFNPSSTTYVKHYYSTTQFVGETNYSGNAFSAGYFNTTSALNAVSFKFSSGNTDAGTIYLYGIR